MQERNEDWLLQNSDFTSKFNDTERKKFDMLSLEKKLKIAAKVK